MKLGMLSQFCTAAGLLIALASNFEVGAHEVSDEAREIAFLAENLDKSIQACGLHAAAFERTRGQILNSRGIALTDEAPPAIKSLSSPSTFGTSKFHHWRDMHAEIWLIASSEKPSCRVGVSRSDWVTKIDDRLDALVQVGNFWRPAKAGETTFVAGEDAVSHRRIYVMETPDSVRIRPTLMIQTAKPEAALAGNQQMIITVLMANKI